MSDDLRDFFSEISKSKQEKKKKLDEAKEELNSIVGDLGLDSLFQEFGKIKKEEVVKKKKQEKKLEAFENFFSNIEEKKEEKKKKPDEYEELKKEIDSKDKPDKPAIVVGVPENFDVSSLEEEEEPVVVEEDLRKKVEDAIIEEPEVKEEEIESQEEKELDEEIEEIKEDASLIEKSLGMLAATDDSEDPLSPLDKKFENFEEFQKHYSVLIQRLQQQLSTLGGGGEVNFKRLDDVTWNGSDDNGKFLKYNSTTEKFEFATVSGSGGGGSIAGIDTTGTSFFNNLNVTGITTIGNVVVGGASTELVVNGDVRVTGILTIGQSSLKLDGTNNIVNVGTALTLGHTNGIQFHTQNLHASGFEINNINASGIVTAGNISVGSSVTATKFYGDGSELTGISGGGGGISNIGIQSAGTLVGTATTLNFASEFNPTVSNNIATVSIGSTITFVGARIYFLNMTPGATGAFTAVDQNDYDGTSIDTHSFYDSTNGRFVIPPGVSKVRFTLTLSKTAGSISNAWQVYKNGTLVNAPSGGFQNEYETSGYSNSGQGAITATLACEEDDYFQLYYYVSANTSTWSGSFQIEVIEGSLLGRHFSSTNVTNADNITVQANNSTDETVYPIFVDGATGLQSPESDTGLMYNPSTGTLTSSVFSGIVATAAQPNITSVGTLGSLNVSGISTLGVTSTTDLTTQQLNVSGVSTFSGDVTFTGDSANILFDKSADKLVFEPDTQIEFSMSGFPGAGLKLLSNDAEGTIKSNDLKFMSVTGNDNYITCTRSAGVQLGYNDNWKFETTNEGVLVSGGATITEDVHVGAGLSVVGLSTFMGGLFLDDNKEIKIGNSPTDPDLIIYHDGNHSYIKDAGTGQIKILTSTLTVKNVADNKLAASFIPGGKCNLLFNNSSKLQTTNEGVLISGISSITNRIDVKSDDGTSGRIHFYCESNNAHYLNLQAPAHADFGGNPTVLLPNSAGTLLLDNGSGVSLTGIVTSIVAGVNVTLAGGPTGIVTVGVTTEQVQDIVGAMFSGNTETNITATYQDSDGTIDLAASGGGGSYTHPNHSGEVTSTGDGATVIADDVVDEANLKVSNSPTNGYFLQAQSGNTGGLTWAAASGGGGGGSPGGSNTQIQYNNSSSFGGVANLTFDGSALGFSGMVKEGVNIVANKLSAATDIDVEDGHVHMFTTNETADATPNIRYNSSAALNTKMSIGDVITLTIIAAVNNINYTYDEVTIDGGAQTELWLGGSAPQAGATGNDVYTYTIIKTADATFTVMINVVNFTA